MLGKLGENLRKTQTLLIYDPQELYTFLATPGIEVTTLLFAGDSMCWISWRHVDEARGPSLRHTNEAIASFLSADARLHLYSYLDMLKEHAVYFNTDSAIFIQPGDDAVLVQTGDCQGAMTSQLKPGELIGEFVSGGLKNYAYKSIISVTGDEKTVCKVSGITLNYSASQLVNFESIKQMILRRDETDTVTVHTERKIKRKGGNGRNPKTRRTGFRF